MYNRLVITSGTSIFNKGNYYGQLIDHYGSDCPLKREGTHVVNSFLDEERAKKAWLDLVKEQGNSFPEPEKVSAEYSLLHALKKERKLEDHLTIMILHTNSFDGELAALMLQHILGNHFSAKVYLKPIPDFNHLNNRIVLNRGLSHFMGLLSEALQEGEPTTTCFSPLGGYKIFSSLGYLVGSLHGYPTAYLHESAQVLHTIPAVRIEIDEKDLRNHARIFRTLYRQYKEDYAPFDQFTTDEQEYMRQNPSFFTIEEKFVTLNPIALFLLEEPSRQWMVRTRVIISKQVEKEIQEQQNHKKYLYGQIGEMIRMLEKGTPNQNGRELYHERTFETLSDLKNKLHIFKGDNQPVPFRASWKVDDGKEEIYIHHLWTDHNLYEEEVKKRKGVIVKEGEMQEGIEITEKFYSLLL